uniref:Protein MIX23 n=1 Tax=Hirondellea gigas TaxID=1518452 RepID=A0A2P2HWD3_9CRUS
MAAENNMCCEDVQFLLQNLRMVDDKIIYALNLATPSQSFHSKVKPAEQCEKLFLQISANYKERGDLLNKCLQSTTARLTQLTAGDPAADPQLKRKIKHERSKVREFRNEIGIEEILRERGRNVFSDKCRQHYRGYEGW